ncbi:MAG: hypothetical protein AAB886_02005 [Patescibacteria group bacterium]
MFALVIDLTGVERLLALPADTLFIELLLTFGWIPILYIFVWGTLQIYLDNKRGAFIAAQRRTTLAIRVPRASEQSPKAVENIFAIVKGTKSVITKKEKWVKGKVLLPTSFDIVCRDGYIHFYVNTVVGNRDLFEAAVYSQYPDAEISEVEDYTVGMPDEFPNETHELFGGEISLDKPNFFPIRTYILFEHMISKENRLKDPIVTLFEVMGRFKRGEQFWLQVLVHPDDGAGNAVKKGLEFIQKTFGKDVKLPPSVMDKITAPVAWIPQEILEQIGIPLGGSAEPEKKDQFKLFNMTHTEKSQLDGVAQKIAKPGFGTKIRWAYLAEHEVYNKGGRNSLWKGYIAQYTHTDWNSFKYEPDTMPRDDYFWMVWEYRRRQRELMTAMKKRKWAPGASPMLLNTEELATLWHFPSIDVKAPLITKTEVRRAEAPISLPHGEEEGDDELSSGPLIEVDEEGNPLGDGDDTADILPTEKMVEDWETGKDERLFTPPNLPT